MLMKVLGSIVLRQDAASGRVSHLREQQRMEEVAGSLYDKQPKMKQPGNVSCGMYNGKIPDIRMNSGIATVGLLIALAVVSSSLLCVIEFYRLFTIKVSVEEDLARAVNIAADLAMLDIYRREHLSELNPAAAYGAFYDYLHDTMGTSGDLAVLDNNGRIVYKLDIEQLIIQNDPPSVKVRGRIGIKPLFIGELFVDEISFRVRGSSVNRRKE